MRNVSPSSRGWRVLLLLLLSPALSVHAQRKGGVDLSHLIDFDVQIALLGITPSTTSVSAVDLIQTHEVTNIVSEWMSDSLRQQLTLLGYTGTYADFDRVVLLERNNENRRRLQADTATSKAQDGGGLDVYHAYYKGWALFARSANQTSVPDEIVEMIQLETLQNDGPLFEALTSSNATGLGSLVKDVRAIVATEGSGSGGQAESATGEAEDDRNMEIVIIIAIAVACVAFMFLLFAIFWAWRYEKRNRDAYLVQPAHNRARDSPLQPNKVDKTGSDRSYDESDHNNNNDSPVHNVEIKRKVTPDHHPHEDAVVDDEEGLPGGFVYPDAVVKNDIATSLSLYYQRGGMSAADGGDTLASIERNGGMHSMMNDAASISSMESYGYSLDGYTLGTPIAEDMYPPNPTTHAQQQQMNMYPPHSRLGAALERTDEADNVITAPDDVEEPVQKLDVVGLGRLEDVEEPFAEDEPSEEPSSSGT